MLRTKFEVPAYIAAIASFLAPLLWFFYPEWPPAVFQAMAAISLFAFVVLLSLLRRQARRTFSPQMGVGVALKALVVGRLPIPKGEWEGRLGVQVLVIAAEDKRDLVQKIVGHYNNRGPQFEYLFINQEMENATKAKLNEKLSKSCSAYVIWSEGTKACPWLVRDINKWAIRETHKAVLVVDCLPGEPYELPFIRIQEAASVEGIWQLIVRATERGQAWRGFALATRAILLIFLLAGAIVISGQAIELHSTSVREREEASKREAMVGLHKNSRAALLPSMGGIASTYSILFEADTNTYDVDDARDATRNYLSGYASYVSRELASRLQFSTEDLPAVTFWRRLRLQGGEEAIVQVGRFPEPEHYCYWKYNVESFVTTAFRKQCFLLWSSDAKAGDDAAWDINGETIGHVKDKWTILFDDNTSVSWTPLADDKSKRFNDAPSRHGYIVYAESGPEGAQVGMSFDTPNAATDLNSALARLIIADALLPLHLFPDAAFETHGLREYIPESKRTAR